jgi:diadenosine tetraphosphatase ApaH/serine/threonine PP2A family protein phosphatase
LVDRGEFSVHTALYVLTLKSLFPDSFFVIRGNRECEDVNSIHGLLAEVIDTYGTKDLFSEFNEVFAVMPLSARINGDFLCVHGGNGPDLTEICQISQIPRPLVNCESPIVSALLWSDPHSGISIKPSIRCRGFEFGEIPLSQFLTANGLKLLVRGHTAIVEGVLFELNREIVTVFSISNYCNEKKRIIRSFGNKFERR